MFSFFKKKSTEPVILQGPSELTKKIAPLQKSAWIPQTEEGDGKRTVSKFSGIPYITDEDTWPVCPNCDNAMQHLVQLNLEDLPNRSQGCPDRGLIQLFYCTNSEPMCEVDCEAFFPGAKSVVARLIKSTEKEPSEVKITPVPKAFPAKVITSWTQKEDSPNWEEIELYGVELNECEEREYEEHYTPLSGDKLLGWPAWVQGVEYPKCHSCDTEMKLLFQIDSECNLPYLFGDVGCGHLCQCPNHPEEIAFGWACG